MKTFAKISLVFILLVNISCLLSAQTGTSNKKDFENKKNLIKTKKERNYLARNRTDESNNYFVIWDESSKDTVLVRKGWVSDNPDMVNLTNEYDISIRIDSSLIIVKDEMTIDSLVVATKKKFPRPFKPKSYKPSTKQK